MAYEGIDRSPIHTPAKESQLLLDPVDICVCVFEEDDPLPSLIPPSNSSPVSPLVLPCNISPVSPLVPPSYNSPVLPVCLPLLPPLQTSACPSDQFPLSPISSSASPLPPFWCGSASDHWCLPVLPECMDPLASPREDVPGPGSSFPQLCQGT